MTTQDDGKKAKAQLFIILVALDKLRDIYSDPKEYARAALGVARACGADYDPNEG